MSDVLYEALARTSLLLRLDAFPGLAAGREGDIADGLRSMGVRIVADRANLASPNGQTALVTLVCQCVMLGARVDLDIPDVAQLIPQPPLREPWVSLPSDATPQNGLLCGEMDHAIAYFLELRIRFRRNPEARAIVDRCLVLFAAAGEADAERMAELECDVEALREELVARFGEKPALIWH